jgi:hypothetical protein
VARLIAVLAGVLVLFLGIASPADAAPSPDQCFITTCTYNGLHHPLFGATTETEHRPPPTFDRGTTYGAVDHWSRGASGCSDEATEPPLSSSLGVWVPKTPAPRPPTTIQPGWWRSQAARTTREQVRRFDGGLSSFDRAYVAAKGGGRVAPDLLRVGDLKLPAVPKGAVGTPTQTGKGMEYVIPRGTPEISERVASVRIMDPVTSGKYQYPNGYAVYMNSSGQTINPLTGQTIARTNPYAHIPLP